MTDWEVRIEGHPACAHQNFERSTLTVDPPISQIRCRNCGRTLWQRHERYVEPWPKVTKGLADVAAGRTKPWAEVRARLLGEGVKRMTQADTLYSEASIAVQDDEVESQP